LQISVGHGRGKEWSDRANSPLEDRLNETFVGLLLPLEGEAREGAQ
jgi:hypothetical protein